jgi:hypothetical protein
MARLSWTEPGERFYETGLDRGVLYPSDGAGIAWNGLLSVNEAPSDSDVTTRYFDGQPYTVRSRAGSFSATIEAFTYPQEFEEYGYLGRGRTLRSRGRFGLSYRTRVANDISGVEYGYKIHLVYNAQAHPSQKPNKTTSSSIEPESLSWDISTVPVSLVDAKASAHLVIDTTIAHSDTVEALEDLLYGNDTRPSFLPQPNEVLEVFESHSIVRITDNGDGTWTAEGPDNLVKMLNATTFEIDIPTAVYLDETKYRISSY